MALHFSQPLRSAAPLAPPRLRASAVTSVPKARFAAKRSESTSVQQHLRRPLSEYMGLPASQYSVLDAERIERVDDSTFRCHVYRLKFFAFELEGSPLVEAQNEKFSASMVNRISYNTGLQNSVAQQLTSNTVIEVTIDIPFAFRALPVEVIESTGKQVLEQLLKLMLPRFLNQLVKDYQVWASGDTSRQPLGTGEL